MSFVTGSAAASTAAASFAWYRDADVRMAIGLYCLGALAAISFDEGMPMWATSPREAHGLGLKAHDVGTIQGAGGVVTCLTPLVLPALQRRLGGAVRAARFGALLAAPATLLFPATRWLASRRAVIALGAALLVPREIGKSCLFIAAFQLISAAAPTQHVGAVNGAGMSAAALCRAAGPSAAGAIIAWSLTNGLSFPLNYWCSFITASAVYAAIVALTFYIREPV